MHIYVCGNITVDEFWQVDHFPAEGESALGNKVHSDVGGKGSNQAMVLSRCGIATTLITATGADSQGEWLRQRVSHERLALLPTAATVPFSDNSVIFTTAEGDNAIMTSNAAANSLTPETVSAHLTVAQPGDIFLQQGNLTPQTTLALFQQAKSRGMITVFNPSPVNPDFAHCWPWVDIAVVNQGEAALLTPTLPPHGSLITTLGAAGAQLQRDQQSWQVAAVKTEVIDTTGAGDTFLAVMLASSLLRQTLPDALALHHATAAAAITVSRRGTWGAFPTRSELQAILARR
ncbi:PfkB family carbohydrate kinase [Pantoea cypripedii]|uniref:Ribokinase n=1 Tax=Pantoea cypripedii TaxID=55209 RepID=A0A1X1EG81_PANCY|nr:PfkB family carbohydrate kinase [Pantoea cypripedii]MBP2199809.1 ribokinase [Pantoea cypripedii]ORM87925.1 ribokinase [Pantoea cypripedii]